ncbi:MAG: CoB--CoM heterodisulfide reductase iron-sulfur subunit B family protein [Desulfobacca sp.]|uniref:CoB--CoM heterodisulfide reductase iron-sulfur subunit B family protein n=1 Tax=Desulfobacca sp. TaxID=2067990 RepID=UPI00404A01B7
MKVSYYPGCSLEGTAADYAASIAGVTPLLGLELAELEDWSCCGASAAHSLSHRLSYELPARNLALAQKAGLDVVVPCALCFNRLKAAEKEAKEETGKAPLDTKIWDLLDFLTQPSFLQQLAQKIKRPLKGLQAVGYYGCLASRPPAITEKKDYENPQEMERLLTVLQAEPIDWSYKTDCCGAGLALARPDLVDTLVGRLYERALAAGAECFVVSCQMCQANLDLSQERISKKAGKNYYLPVFYFTELMGLALGHPEVPNWLSRHLVDPRPLLQKRGLL